MSPQYHTVECAETTKNGQWHLRASIEWSVACALIFIELKQFVALRPERFGIPSTEFWIVLMAVTFRDIIYFCILCCVHQNVRTENDQCLEMFPYLRAGQGITGNPLWQLNTDTVLQLACMCVQSIQCRSITTKLNLNTVSSMGLL